ncbi:hypothetical protein [Paraburkholderia sediminicola]|uniref:hypothetical protein n=1 Tax=Paraburkholderia sediminicola TaxID=458836 RepID=UPI0038B705FC
MSQWNTLSVPLATGLQCTLVLADQYGSSSGVGLRFIRNDGELRELEEDRQDFDRYFRPRGDLRTVSGQAALRTIQSFLSESLNVAHWNLPADNAGIERMLREAVADGRLVPVVNRESGSPPQVSRPVPAPERWPSGGGGLAGGGQKWAAFAGAGSSPLSFNGEAILSGSYDPATQEARLIAARGAMAASEGGGGLLGVVEAMAGAALGGAPNDGGDTSTLLGDAHPFEYAEDAMEGDSTMFAGLGERGNMYACDIISSECKGSVLREFPGQYLNSTLNDIQSDAQDGVKDARKAFKLLNDSRFKK